MAGKDVIVVLKILIFSVSFIFQSFVQTQTTDTGPLPTLAPLQDSLFRLELNTNHSCQYQIQQSWCLELRHQLMHHNCIILPTNCTEQPHVIRLEATFNKIYTGEEVMAKLELPKDILGILITNAIVWDVDECIERRNQCSANGRCSNTPGSYQCFCRYGFKDISAQRTGIKCAEKCASRTCFNGGECNDATNELDGVTCECPSGFVGSRCELKGHTLTERDLIIVSVFTAIAALTGLVLLAYACIRARRFNDGTAVELRSISDYKPKNILDITQFSENSSYARINRGFNNASDEESERSSSIFTRSNGLKYSNKKTVGTRVYRHDDTRSSRRTTSVAEDPSLDYY